MILQKTKKWFQKNRLLLNENKTNIIIFKTKMNKNVIPEKVNFNENQLDIQTTTKFLGVHIDEFLDWSGHIEKLSEKLNRICVCFRIVLKYMNETAKRTLYFANFESTARFGIIFWASNSKIQNIFVIQKRIIRLMFGMSYLESWRGIFRRKAILTIYGLYIFDAIMFLFKS